MSLPNAHTHGFGRPAHGRAPANRAIVLLACLGGTVTLLTVTVIAVATGGATGWLTLAPVVGAAGCGVAGLRAWRLVTIHGYFHEPAADDPTDDEDEDSNPEGGSGVRYPPDAPDGGGSLEFDWDGFLAGFAEHVEATGREPALR